MIRFLQKSGQTTKYVLGGLLIIICASMVITLIPGGLGSEVFGGAPGKGIIAKVGGDEITADEVRETARQMLQQRMPQGGANMGMLLPFFTQQAAEQLITRQALISEAQHMGLRVTPDEIKDELQHGRYAATFFPGGTFIGQTEYEDMLQRVNLTPAKFEEAIGNDILLTKLQALISDSANISEFQIHEQFVKENTKVKFDYAVLKQDDIMKGLHPGDAELKAFYDAHKATYANSIPEKRKVKYAVIDISKAEASVQVTPDDLRSYFDAHRDEYRVPEQVKVSHILIKTPLPGPDGKVDEKGVAEAQQRAQDLLKQLKAGANFEDLARKYSEDPGSAKQGGSLGWIGRGQTVPEFEKVAFSLPKGQMSDLVKSSYGFHIIRIDDKQEAHSKTLDEVKGEIEPILKRQKAQQLVQKQADKLLNNARAQGLDAAAAAQGIPVITSDYFSRKDMLPGLGPAPQFMDAVFAAQPNSPPDMASSTQGTAIFQLLDIKPPATPTFEEVRSKVEEEFKNERSRQLLNQKIQELSDRAKAEHDLKRAAKELGATIKTSDLVLPDAQVPDVGAMSGQAAVAFTMKPGEISGAINSGADAVVLQLLESQPPSEADFAAKRDQIRDQLLQGKRQERFQLFVSNLVDEMTKSGKIKRNEEEIKALSRSGSDSGM
ncbi:MAG TPA: peptidyl-prolyl cis-trans isomerase [Candidatus Sulfotelmatobacter sp.]|jgi:peptidyl-prolyl cis-trans isomerase D|nr:peptidyl-prolyl cis-trans isomerase [Candidatus Sulfotelmatobacter sp.]